MTPKICRASLEPLGVLVLRRAPRASEVYLPAQVLAEAREKFMSDLLVDHVDAVKAAREEEDRAIVAKARANVAARKGKKT